MMTTSKLNSTILIKETLKESVVFPAHQSLLMSAEKEELQPEMKAVRAELLTKILLPLEEPDQELLEVMMKRERKEEIEEEGIEEIHQNHSRVATSIMKMKRTARVLDHTTAMKAVIKI
jgi:thymidylate kinase